MIFANKMRYYVLRKQKLNRGLLFQPEFFENSTAVFKIPTGKVEKHKVKLK